MVKKSLLGLGKLLPIGMALMAAHSLGQGLTTGTIKVEPNENATATANEVVTVGIPFASCTLTSLGSFKLKDNNGVEVPVFVKKTMDWPSRAPCNTPTVRSIKVQFVFDATGGTKTYSWDLTGRSTTDITEQPVAELTSPNPLKLGFKEPRVFAINDPAYLVQSGLLPPSVAKTSDPYDVGYYPRQWEFYSRDYNYLDPGADAWLFDRVSSNYGQAMRLGEAKYYREAYLSHEFYIDKIDDTGKEYMYKVSPSRPSGTPDDYCVGGFNFFHKADSFAAGGAGCDSKYIYAQAIKLHLALTGDDSYQPDPENKNTFINSRNDLWLNMADLMLTGSRRASEINIPTVPKQGFTLPFTTDAGYTERKTGLGLQTVLSVCQLTLDTSVCNATDTIIENMWNHQQNNPDGRDAGAASGDKRGYLAHSWAKHEGGNPYVGVLASDVTNTTTLQVTKPIGSISKLQVGNEIVVGIPAQFRVVTAKSASGTAPNEIWTLTLNSPVTVNTTGMSDYERGVARKVAASRVDPSGLVGPANSAAITALDSDSAFSPWMQSNVTDAVWQYYWWIKDDPSDAGNVKENRAKDLLIGLAHATAKYGVDGFRMSPTTRAAIDSAFGIQMLVTNEFNSSNIGCGLTKIPMVRYAANNLMDGNNPQFSKEYGFDLAPVDGQADGHIPEILFQLAAGLYFEPDAAKKAAMKMLADDLLEFFQQYNCTSGKPLVDDNTLVDIPDATIGMFPANAISAFNIVCTITGCKADLYPNSTAVGGISYPDRSINWQNKPDPFGTYKFVNSFRVDYAGNGVFFEAGSDDGTMLPMNITIGGATFRISSGTLVQGSDYTITGLPAGITGSTLTVTSATTATLTLQGKATSNQPANNINNVNFEIKDAALLGFPASQLQNFAKLDMALQFRPSLSYSTTTFEESPNNNGSVDTQIDIDVSADTFTGTVALNADFPGTLYQVTGLPSGLTAKLTKISTTRARLTLTGTAASHLPANNLVNIGLVYKDGIFTSTGAVTGNGFDTTLALTFYDPQLSYSGTTFSENAASNNGTISTTATVTMTGGTFVDLATLVLNTHYTVANLPAGLTPQISLNPGRTAATVSFSGTATTHSNASDRTNLGITFLPAAFVRSYNNANVPNAVRNNLSMQFVEPAISYSGTGFTENAGTNNGAVTGTVTATLSDDTFVNAGGNLTLNTHFTMPTLPTGLTPVVSVNGGGTVATVSFTGNATQHGNTQDQSGTFAINFLPAAFTNTTSGANITGISKTNLNMLFVEPAITYSGTVFDEDVNTNNGSIVNTLTLTLTDDTFRNEAFVLGTHFTATNVPAGLTLAANRLSNSQVRLSLTGNATAHTDVNDTSNIAVGPIAFAFLPQAFTNATVPANVPGATGNLNVDFVQFVLTYNGTEFREGGQNDGATSNVLTLTLGGASFAVTGNTVMTAGTHYDITGLPAGFTGATVTGVNATTATVALTGKANSHLPANNVSTVTLAFKDAAFVGGTAAQVTGSTKSGLSLNFYDVQISYSSSTFLESAASNNGAISNTIVATISGDLLNATVGQPLASNRYSLSNVPAGLTPVVQVTSTSQVSISFTGNATAHGNANDLSGVNGIHFQLLGPAFLRLGTPLPVKDFNVDFVQPTLTPAGLTISEVPASNDGTLGTLAFSVSEDTFSNAGGTLTLNTHYQVSNLPAGLTPVMTVNGGGTVATLSFTGTATSHGNAQDIANLGVQFLNGAFATTTTAASVTGNPVSNIAINFVEPVISYSGTTFTENANNNGTISNTLTLTLADDTFVAGPFVAGTHYTVANVPAGLTLAVNRSSATTLGLTLTGTATAHAVANNVSNVAFALTGDAFAGADSVINITGATNNLAVSYVEVGLNYSGNTFTERSTNDGGSDTALTVGLVGSSFTVTGNAAMTAGVHYNVSGVPAGLTLVVTGVNASTASLTLTGNATSHATDISGITLTFLDAAFTGGNASNINNYIKNDLAINFIAPAISLSGTVFTESGGNDGTIAGTVVFTLVDDTFTAGPFASGTHYTLSNVPTGLTAIVTRTGANTVTLSLAGAATAHAAANNVGNLSIAFTNAAFTSGAAAGVVNSSVSTLSINFNDPAPSGGSGSGGSTTPPVQTVTGNTTLTNDSTGTIITAGAAVVNQSTLTNPVNSGTITGGALDGTITNTNGVVQNVELKPGAVLNGGEVKGEVRGAGVITNALVDVTDVGDGVQLGSGTKVTATTVLANPGLNLTGAVTGQNGVVNLDQPLLVVPTPTGAPQQLTVGNLVSNTLNQLFGNQGTDIDSTATNVVLTNPNLVNVEVPVVPVAIVTTTKPNGLVINAQGQVEVVSNGIQTTFNTTTPDQSAFVAGLASLGASTATGENNLQLAVFNGVTFTFRFSLFVDVPASTPGQSLQALSSGASTFIEEGRISNPLTYRIVTKYPDGSKQDLVPFVHKLDEFAGLVAAAGNSYSVSAIDGLIVVKNKQGAVVNYWMPAYTVQAIPLDQLPGAATLTPAGDLNKDGVPDSYFTTNGGKQVLYGIRL